MLVLAPRAGSALLITFDSLSDSTPITNQFAGQGVLFTNAVAATAGISLNEIEFPPKSGMTVAVNSGSPMIIDFTSPFIKVSGFFTYTGPLTLTAFSGMDGTGSVLGTATSMFAENFVSSGNPPNEMLMIAAPGIESLVISTSNPEAGFTLDNFGAVGRVPEPATILLLGGGLAALYANRRRPPKLFRK